MSHTMYSPEFCTPYHMAVILHDCRFSGGLSASGQSAGFAGNVFSRDWARVVRDVMPFPEFAPFMREMFSTLAQWQGVRKNPATNEFKDAMPHQVFRQCVGGRILSSAAVDQAEFWSGQWNVPMRIHPVYGKQFVIYNSSDAAPLYLVALAEYCRRYGVAVLSDSFRHDASGEIRTVAEAAHRCVRYIVRAILDDESNGPFGGLYAVPNTNPKQTSPSGVMRDGFDAYVRSDGRAIDYGRVAYVENQALAYEALILASTVLFPNDKEAKNWWELARRLRVRTLEQFWLNDQQRFAAAIDHHGVVDMASSAAFELLNGSFFANHTDGPDYVQALVSGIFSAQFMTRAGVRMTSLAHVSLEGEYWAYQGSRAVWGVTNGIITQGLLQWGFARLACDLAHRRFIPSLNNARQAVEMLYVDDATGEPLYAPQQSDGNATERVAYPAEIGQNDQAWTASAALKLLQTDCTQHIAERGSWAHVLDVRLAKSMREMPAAIDSQPVKWFVDIAKGKERKSERASRLGYAA